MNNNGLNFFNPILCWKIKQLINGYSNTKLLTFYIYLTESQIKLLMQHSNDPQTTTDEIRCDLLCSKIKKLNFCARMCVWGVFAVIYVNFLDPRNDVSHQYNVVIVLFYNRSDYNDIVPMIYKSHCINIENMQNKRVRLRTDIRTIFLNLLHIWSL